MKITAKRRQRSREHPMKGGNGGRRRRRRRPTHAVNVTKLSTPTRPHRRLKQKQTKRPALHPFLTPTYTTHLAFLPLRCCLRPPMASSNNGAGKMSAAVDAIIAEAADMIALEQIAKLNTAHLPDDSSLPAHLDSRFRKLKSFPTTNTTPIKTLDRSATAPPPPQPSPAPAPAIQEQRQEAEAEKESSPPRPPATFRDDEENFRPTLRERNRGREYSPSPPRQACCFGFSPKRALNRAPGRGKGDLLGLGDLGEWGDENRRMATELKEQQRKLKKALREQEKVSRETANMARWVKQASARMTHAAAIDDLLSDCENDDDELK